MNDDSKKLLEQFQPTEIRRIEAYPQIYAARFSPCGKYMVAGGFEPRVRRWDITDPPVEKEEEKPADDPKAKKPPKKKVKPEDIPSPELASLEGHNGWVEALAFHGDTLFTSDSWGQIRAWPYAEAKPKPHWIVKEAHDGWVRHLEVSPDGKTLASCARDGVVRLWSTADGKKIKELVGHNEDIFSLCFTPDGKSLISGDMKGIVKQWDLASGKVTRQFDAGVLFFVKRLQDIGGVRCLALDKDAKLLAVGGTKPSNGGTVQGIPTVLLFDFATGKLKETLELGKTNECFVHEVAFHDAGFIMAVTSGTPGAGRFLMHRPGDEAPFYIAKGPMNCRSLSRHGTARIAVTSCQRGSNGNGRRLNKDGEYEGNKSPIHIYELTGTEKAS